MAFFFFEFIFYRFDFADNFFVRDLYKITLISTVYLVPYTILYVVRNDQNIQDVHVPDSV